MCIRDRLKSVDKSLGVMIILLGVMQSLTTFYFFRRMEEPAAWYFAGGMLLMVVGALTLLRLKYGEIAPGVKYVSLAANLMLSLFWIALYWLLFDKFARHPASFTGLFVILASAIVSLRQTWRAQPQQQL